MMQNQGWVQRTPALKRCCSFGPGHGVVGFCILCHNPLWSFLKFTSCWTAFLDSGTRFTFSSAVTLCLSWKNFTSPFPTTSSPQLVPIKTYGKFKVMVENALRVSSQTWRTWIPLSGSSSTQWRFSSVIFKTHALLLSSALLHLKQKVTRLKNNMFLGQSRCFNLLIVFLPQNKCGAMTASHVPAPCSDLLLRLRINIEQLKKHVWPKAENARPSKSTANGLKYCLIH